MVIDSIKDPAIRAVRDLGTCKSRRENGRVVVVGSRACTWLQASGRYVIETLLRLEGKALPNAVGEQDFEVSRGVISKVSDQDLGPVMIGRRLPSEPYRSSRILILDGTSDPGNVGCLMRSAAAFGFQEVHLVGMVNEDGFTRQAISASRGAVFDLDIFYHHDSAAAVEAFQVAGLAISGLAARKGAALSGSPTPSPIVLAVGSEAQGLSEELEAACNRFLNIPIADTVESLNVAVAGSIGMYSCRSV